MVEIAVYNLVAVWIREHGNTVPMDAANDLDGATVLDHAEVFAAVNRR
jgi:hypothetical protein